MRRFVWRQGWIYDVNEISPNMFTRIVSSVRRYGETFYMVHTEYISTFTMPTLLLM